MVSIKYLKASDSLGEAVKATVNVTRAIGATTLSVDTITKFPPFFIATSGVLNAETGYLNSASMRVFLGHISGANIIIDSFAPGYSDAGNAVGDVVLIKPTTKWVDELIAALLVSFNDNGTLNAAALTSILGVGNTASNLRMSPRISSTASTATLTPAPNSYNQYEITAQAAGLTIANPSAGGVTGDIMIIQIKDNGTSRAITYGNAYTNVSGLDSLTATVPNKWHTIGIKLNGGAVAWQIVSISTEA